MFEQKIKCIFATGSQGEFGKNGKLPWDYIKSDFEHFARYTKNSVVVMGVFTWESLRFKLGGRVNVVLSSKVIPPLGRELPDLSFSCDLSVIIHNLKSRYPDKHIIIIGGKSLIEVGIPLCDEVSWTQVDESYKDCDVFIDPQDILNSLRSEGFLLDYVETRVKGEGFTRKVFKK
jgi:dihydrofolate reductase